MNRDSPVNFRLCFLTFHLGRERPENARLSLNLLGGCPSAPILGDNSRSWKPTVLLILYLVGLVIARISFILSAPGHPKDNAQGCVKVRWVLFIILG